MDDAQKARRTVEAEVATIERQVGVIFVVALTALRIYLCSRRAVEAHGGQAPVALTEAI